MSSANFIKERLKQIENFLYNNKAKVWKIALEHTIPGYGDGVVWLDHVSSGKLKLSGATYTAGEDENPENIKDSVLVYTLKKNWREDALSGVGIEDFAEALVESVREKDLKKADMVKFQKLNIDVENFDKKQFLFLMHDFTSEQQEIFDKLIAPIEDVWAESSGYEYFSDEFYNIVEQVLKEAENLIKRNIEYER